MGKINFCIEKYPSSLMRKKILQMLYCISPFDLSGDCVVPKARDGIKISCIINFYGRLEVLSGILFSLASQNFPRNQFEVILVEDRGGTEEGRNLTRKFESLLPIVYSPLDKNYGLMGYSRNYGLVLSRGEYILFLDDDTVILQQDFLSVLLKEFESGNADGIVANGSASFYLSQAKYGYLDCYFPANRCTAYRRAILAELRGFVSAIIGQEDVEFVMRFIMAGKIYINSTKLFYFHPPHVVPNFRKPKAVGYSFYQLKERYPFLIWFLMIINCARHTPLYLIPLRKFREHGRFGAGFLAGVVMSPFKKEGYRYG